MLEYLSRVIMVILSSTMLLGYGAPVIAYAHDGVDDTAAHAAERTPAKVAERVEKRKVELKTKLDAAQTTRLKGRCKASQSILTKSRERSEEVQKRRLGHYNDLQVKVDELVVKLVAADISTEELTTAKAQVSLSAEALKAAFASYQTALDDAAAIDCVADPIGFKASLDAARKLHDDIGKSYAELRKTIANNLAPALANAKKQIKPSVSEGGN